MKHSIIYEINKLTVVIQLYIEYYYLGSRYINDNVPHDSGRYFISDDFRSLCLRCYIYIHGKSRRRQRGSLIVVLVVQWAKQSKSVKTSN